MAAAEAASIDDKKAAKAKGPLVPIIAAALLSALLAGGVAFFLGARGKAPAATAAGSEPAAATEHGAEAKSEEHGDAKDEGKARPAAVYLPLSPAFVVNLGEAEAGHFLQVDMEVLVKSEAESEKVKLHSPQIRNAILMLMSQQKMAEMATREGKEALQKQVLDETRKILVKETGKPCVDAVFFTSFVMQ